MKKNDLKNYINDLVEQIKESRINPENQFIELKSEWINLSKKDENYPENKSKFLKEVCSLANSYGPNIRYLIFGVEEKSGKLIDAPFIKSGLKDRSDLSKLIFSGIKPKVLFSFDEIKLESDKRISVLSIENSSLKPYVMNENVTGKHKYENYIAVRSAGGEINSASRADIDLMLYDNGNTLPEYDLSIFPASSMIINPNLNNRSPHPANINFTVVFENKGRKHILVQRCKLITNVLSENSNIISAPYLKSYRYSESGDTDKQLHLDPILIPSGSIIPIRCKFYDDDRNPIFHLLQSKEFNYRFEVTDFNGNTFSSTLHKR